MADNGEIIFVGFAAKNCEGFFCGGDGVGREISGWTFLFSIKI